MARGRGRVEWGDRVSVVSRDPVAELLERDAELARVHRAFGRARAGSGATIVVGGPSRDRKERVVGGGGCRCPGVRA
jgi:hypothetical protein